MMQFSLYPLQVALANDQVAPERRVSLTACLLMAFGIGASIGPLVVGALIQPLGSNMLYLFFTLCALMIAGLSYVKAPGPLPTTEVPLPHVVMPDSLATSPLGAALIPTLEEEVIQASMGSGEPEPEPDPDDLQPDDDRQQPEPTDNRSPH